MKFLIAALFLLAAWLTIREALLLAKRADKPQISFNSTINSGSAWINLPKFTRDVSYTVTVQEGGCLRVQAAKGDYIVDGDSRMGAIDFCIAGEEVLIARAELEDGWKVYRGRLTPEPSVEPKP